MVADLLEERDYGSASALEGGLDAWEQQGYPTADKTGSYLGADRAA